MQLCTKQGAQEMSISKIWCKQDDMENRIKQELHLIINMNNPEALLSSIRIVTPTILYARCSIFVLSKIHPTLTKLKEEY